MSKAPKRIWKLLHEIADNATTSVRSSRHAAAICYKGAVLSYGVNSYKTHPMMLLYGKNEESIFLHAEIDALVRAISGYGADLLKDCSLYVLRLNKKGEVAPSCPCSGCQKAIEAFQIKKVYHT